MMMSYHWSEDYCRKRLTGAKGWVYYNLALENQVSLFGGSLKRVSDGYIAQEIKSIVKKKKK